MDKLDELYGVALHVVVGYQVAMCYSNGFMSR